MSINLVLNSSNSLFYNTGLARFFVNWSQFFEDDSHAKYDMTFSFISKPEATIDDNDLFVVTFENLGSTLKTIAPIGQSGVGSTSSTIMGIIKPERVQNASSNRLFSNYLDNPPVTIWGRPTENLLEVSFKDLDNALGTKDPHFVMIVRFHKL